MSQFVEFLAMGMGTHTDASGNIIWPGTQAAAPAADQPAPDSAPAPVAAPSAPAQPVAPSPSAAPVKAPTASIPEPPTVGQASPDDPAAQLKKTLLGG